MNENNREFFERSLSLIVILFFSLNVFSQKHLLPCTLQSQTLWKPMEGPLTTKWTKDVSPTNVHSEYPRPQMVRKEWKNLNGLWDYSIVPLFEKPVNWDGKILVPFPVESMLSGVSKKVGPQKLLWYKKIFTIPSAWKQQHILLHFGAVDWQATVWVNGKEMGRHEGGFDNFSFDITNALKPGVKQEIIVAVWDPSNEGYHPAGKQYNNPHSIWYTSTTGIWQTVWMEPLPEVSIKDFRITPDINTNTLSIIFPWGIKRTDYIIKAIAYSNGKEVAVASGNFNDTFRLRLKEVKLWSPSDPYLYDLVITVFKNGKKTDEVMSYFGMRDIKLAKDANGYTRMFLNNKPLFQMGPLDQGFWPDGLYTAPTDDALKYDIEFEKKAGYNMIRKHVKVEPERWYYWCDKIGMLVWQDMPSGDKHIRSSDTDIVRSSQSAYQYKTELKEMIDEHYNHPSIVTWVPFNEGWGQFETASITSMIRKLDPTRLINSTSGWSDRNVGDLHDIHVYPGPDMPFPETVRAAVLGEYGGQALVIKDHLWMSDLSKAPTHIRTSQTREDLESKYIGWIDSLIVLKKKGLSAAVYTQTTDVETEVNGIITYDRKIIKMDIDRVRTAHLKLITEK
ncbi:MAG: sugar-binding domain-containing protein [Ginsengibacter sp.]